MTLKEHKIVILFCLNGKNVIFPIFIFHNLRLCLGANAPFFHVELEEMRRVEQEKTIHNLLFSIQYQVHSLFSSSMHYIHKRLTQKGLIPSFVKIKK